MDVHNVNNAYTIIGCIMRYLIRHNNMSNADMDKWLKILRKELDRFEKGLKTPASVAPDAIRPALAGGKKRE